MRETRTSGSVGAPGRQRLGATRPRLHEWSSSDLLASSTVAVVEAPLYLALAGSITPTSSCRYWLGHEPTHQHGPLATHSWSPERV